MSDNDKSWRDIDRQRDKSRHRDNDDGGSRKSGQDKRRDAKYKKDLDKVFKSGGKVPERFQEVMGDLGPEEGSPEAARQEAIDELREADGFREFAKAVNTFVSRKLRFPDDEDLLIRMLDHPDNEIVRKTLAHLVDLSDRRDLERVTPLKSRMSTIRTMTDDSRITELVEKLEGKL